MISKGLMVFLRLSRRLGVRVLVLAVLALSAVFLAPLLDPLIPQWLKSRITADAVLPILNILASTMLAVTTFSLGVMVQASQAASSQATPRAHRIVMADTTTQTVLATFVGAFLFSLTALVMFRAGLYGDTAPVVIFAFTVLTIALIILAILRWIDHLRRLGSMDHTLHMIEGAARGALRDMARVPALGANPATKGSGPQGVRTIAAPASGYLEFVDMPKVQARLKDANAEIWLDVQPGDYVLKGHSMGRLTGGDPALADALVGCFHLGEERGLEQDPRFGIMILSEIGIRAMSPGLNDPGTAIDVARRLTALLWAVRPRDAEPVRFDRVHAVPVTATDLLQDAFATLARDGKDYPEVCTQIEKGLDALGQSAWPDMAMAAQKRREDLPRA